MEHQRQTKIEGYGAWGKEEGRSSSTSQYKNVKESVDRGSNFTKGMSWYQGVGSTPPKNLIGKQHQTLAQAQYKNAPKEEERRADGNKLEQFSPAGGFQRGTPMTTSPSSSDLQRQNLSHRRYIPRMRNVLDAQNFAINQRYGARFEDLRETVFHRPSYGKYRKDFNHPYDCKCQTCRY